MKRFERIDKEGGERFKGKGGFLRFLVFIKDSGRKKGRLFLLGPASLIESIYLSYL